MKDGKGGWSKLGSRFIIYIFCVFLGGPCGQFLHVQAI